MPATTPAPGKSKPEENGKFRFAKCELTDGQKQDLRRWRDDLASLDALLAWVDKRVISGHTVTVKGQEVGYLALMTGVRETSGHKDVSLTARASSPVNALYALQYKDEILLKGKWEVADWANELDL